MNEERKDKLVYALRSGEYTQTHGCLRNDTGFCCLGVATDIYIRETGKNWVTITGSTERYGLDVGDPAILDVSTLAHEVKDWFGMKTQTGVIFDNDASTLSILNDSGYTFKEIAEVIEENWQSL